jgi:hypothetical protein
MPVCSWGLLRLLLDGGLEAGQGLVPEVVEIRAQIAQAVGIEPIDAAGADRLVDDQPGILQHLQVLGDRGPADWQVARQLTDRPWTIGQPFEDGSPRGVAQGRQRIRLVSCHER